MSNWRRQRAFIGEKVPENGSFRDQFGGAWGIWPRSGANHTHKLYTDELQILSSLCMPRHDFATAVKVATQISCATGLGVPIWYTLFKVSAQLVCSWLPYSVHEFETPGASTRQYFVVHTVSFVFIDVELTTPEGVHWRKVPENGSFRDQFWRGVGHLAPLRGKSHTQTIHRWTTNIV